MQNLLLADGAAKRLQKELDGIQGLNVLALQADGSVILNDKPVSLEDHPVHIGWISQELFQENLFRQYARILQDAPALRWVQTITAGLDLPMFKDLLEKGARLTNSDAQAPAIAEYVVGSVLHQYQHFPERMAMQAKHQWQPVPFRQIYGTTWLIVGFGNIGRLVGRMVKGFDGQVIGVKRQAQASPDADQIVTFEALPEHLPAADVIVIACALTEQTRGLVDQAFLSQLKQDCIIINIARGDVVDEAALLASLDEGRIEHAVLDVFSQEPLPADSPFWSHERVLVTPHASSLGDATGPRSNTLFLSNLTCYLNGEPMRNEVDLGFFNP